MPSKEYTIRLPDFAAIFRSIYGWWTIIINAAAAGVGIAVLIDPAVLPSFVSPSQASGLAIILLALVNITMRLLSSGPEDVATEHGPITEDEISRAMASYNNPAHDYDALAGAGYDRAPRRYSSAHVFAIAMASSTALSFPVWMRIMA